MGDHSGGFKLGDRVRKDDGTTGIVVEPPAYYDASRGYPFTGWAVTVEVDTDPEISLTRIERGLSPGSWELVSPGRLTHIAD
jgi:hypothetical protein